MHGVSASNGERGGRGASSSGARHRGQPRLLVITPDYPPARGGIQLLVHRVVSGLGAFDTRVLTLDCPEAESFDADSALPIRRVGAAGRSSLRENLSLNGSALLQAARFRPHLTLSAHIVVSPAAAAMRRLLRTRTVQYFYAKEIGARPRLAAFAARQAHASIAISSYTEDLLEGAGAATTGVRLIPPGVDLPSDTAPLASVRPTLLTISRLADPYKGHDVLIRSLAQVRSRVPDVEWIVIGDGPLRGGLEELARSCGLLESVRFVGAVSDEQRDEWLRRTDLLAMPSRLPGAGRAGEGFGIVYLEAAAYGKPVVAGNVAGAVDAVVDGETGLLVDPTDPAAVAGAITELLLDRELAARLGGAGALRAKSFAWPLIAQRVEALLLEQLDPSRRVDLAGAAPQADSARAVT
jgi:phosphatidylinositol alpha-1,6-mannosyltransferase